MATVHVYPEADLIEHDTDGGDCICGPDTEPVTSDDGSFGWLVSHHYWMDASAKPLETRRNAPTGHQ